MQELYDALDKAARSRMNVLIRGENGTGKELAARSIHFRSARKGGPFVKLNCAAIPESLVESELFGVEGGTATGVQKRIGRFEQASGGTLFLDEIGDMPLAVQAKVLRAIQEQEIERVGGRRTITIDVRIIAATHRDLEQGVEEGAFRRDLYYRLRVVELRVPPLRERREDIPLLAMHFLHKLCAAEGKTIEGFTSEAWTLLSRHPWPGNVRELENAIAQAVVLCDGKRVRPGDLAGLGAERAAGGGGGRPGELLAAGSSLKDVMARVERELLEHALAEAASPGAAAERLGIGRSTLYAKLKQYGLIDKEHD